MNKFLRNRNLPARRALETLRPFFLFGCLTVALALAPAAQGPRHASESLASMIPPGPLLFLEAQDLQALIHDWNASPEKQLWLKSDDYQSFSRSRLLLRLKEAQGEFAEAGGVPPDMSLVESVAGGESALALYNIGSLEFVYVTRLPLARATESILWKTREKFEPRKLGELPYYVRSEPSKHRVVALAATDDFLLLATREDLLRGALQLVAGRGGPTLNDEQWFQDAVRVAGQPGDLRLALNLPALVRSPHFRSYWIQRNVSMLRQYEAEVADVFRSSGEIREDRFLVRSRQGEPSAPQPVEAASPEESAVAGVLRFVPDDTGLYRAWAGPTMDEALALLERKVLAPRPGLPPASKVAPSTPALAREVGTQADLETRIDLPPLETSGAAFGSEALKKLLEGKKLEAMLQLQSTRVLPGEVLVGIDSAVVLRASTDWDAEASRAALQATVQNLWTASGLGTSWVKRENSARTYYELEGLESLATATQGPFLIVASSSPLLQTVLGRMSNPPAARGGVYAAGFRHGRERDHLAQMLRLIETPFAERLVPARQPGDREPLFFSENLASLSQALARVESESILVRDRGDTVAVTLSYRLSR